MSQADVYIVHGSRTPVGAFLGGLSSLTAPQLGAVTLKATLERASMPSPNLDEVIMGCVLQGGVGQAPARQAAIAAEIPTSIGATTINKVCGSGLKAVMTARSEILAGEADLILAGGMESMSQAPFFLKNARNGYKMGNQTLEDLMIHDGLWDPYGHVHMGNCAERCVEKYGFTREQLDAYALSSQQRALQAQQSGAFSAEIAPVTIPQKKGEPVVVSQDEGPRESSLEKMASLRPAFEKEGKVTAANASTLNDGAASVLVASAQAVSQHGLKPMAKILGVATFSQDPVWFTTAPVGAIQTLCQKTGVSVDEIDLFEISEAFAAVVLATMLDLNLPHNKINIHGGGISLGHPIGASGARLLVSLLYALRYHQKRLGVACLCIGGGEAVAVLVEAV